MDKLFTSILNTRLCRFIEINNLLSLKQAGFRKKHSTVDNIFILHLLSKYLKTEKCKLFCAVTDLKKAFASVWRAGLWCKLLKYNINGNVSF